LEGVSDPMQFNQYVVDMVVAKQGATEPIWERTGAPPPVGMGRGLKRLRMARRLREEEGGGHGDGRRRGDGGRTGERGAGGAAASDRTGASGGAGTVRSADPTGAGSVRRPEGADAEHPDGERRGRPDPGRPDGDRGGEPSPAPPIDDELAALDAETLAARLRSPGGPDLPWRK